MRFRRKCNSSELSCIRNSANASAKLSPSPTSGLPGISTGSTSKRVPRLLILTFIECFPSCLGPHAPCSRRSNPSSGSMRIQQAFPDGYADASGRPASTFACARASSTLTLSSFSSSSSLTVISSSSDIAVMRPPWKLPDSGSAAVTALRCSGSSGKLDHDGQIVFRHSVHLLFTFPTRFLVLAASNRPRGQSKKWFLRCLSRK